MTCLFFEVESQIHISETMMAVVVFYMDVNLLRNRLAKIRRTSFSLLLYWRRESKYRKKEEKKFSLEHRCISDIFGLIMYCLFINNVPISVR